MLDGIIEAIESFFLESVGKELCVFFCSMIPIIELRGAIPLGAALGLPLWESFVLSVVGNMLPVPIILLFVKKVLFFMSRCRVKLFNKVANWVYAKAEKNRSKIEKYSFWGVAAFVGIPLPMTGAWTGSLVAAFIDMKFWRALLSALVGVLVAAVIMSLISYGAVAIFALT